MFSFSFVCFGIVEILSAMFVFLAASAKPVIMIGTEADRFHFGPLSYCKNLSDLLAWNGRKTYIYTVPTYSNPLSHIQIRFSRDNESLDLLKNTTSHCGYSSTSGMYCNYTYACRSARPEYSVTVIQRRRQSGDRRLRPAIEHGSRQWHFRRRHRSWTPNVHYPHSAPRSWMLINVIAVANSATWTKRANHSNETEKCYSLEQIAFRTEMRTDSYYILFVWHACTYVNTHTCRECGEVLKKPVNTINMGWEHHRTTYVHKHKYKHTHALWKHVLATRMYTQAHDSAASMLQCKSGLHSTL